MLSHVSRGDCALNIMLTLAYDGTNYSGWQKQENSVAVQEILETALSKAYGTNIIVKGTSRTDAGVHALDQRAVFEISETPIPVKRLPVVINNLLPDDISVLGACEVSAEFAWDFSAAEKTYLYKICNNRYRNPLMANYCWHISKPLNIALMQEAAAYFIGEHDFIGFSATGSPRLSSVRTIYDLNVSEKDNIITISVTGNGFLYNMVRIIAGTLVYVGLGKVKPAEIPHIIKSKDRTLAGPTAPSHGLVLAKLVF